MTQETGGTNQLAELFQQGKFSRREFIRRSLLAGLSLSAAQALLAACAPPAAAPAAQAIAGEAPAAAGEPQSGGTITWAIESDVVNLIPFGGVSTANHWGNEFMYDSLLEWDKDLNVRSPPWPKAGKRPTTRPGSFICARG